MIQPESKVKVYDNSGAIYVKVIKILKGSSSGTIGDIVVCSVRKVRNKKNKQVIKKGDIVYGLIVNTKKEVKRLNGMTIRFDNNGVILLKRSFEIMGNRIFCPLTKELRTKKFIKITSLSKQFI